MKRLLLVALGMALLLALASAPPAAAYGGESSATMSCTDNTSTMTRTVFVTITWHAVKDGGVAESDAQVYETSPANLLAWGRTPVSPPEARGTASFMLSFNDTTPFGNVQWQLYNSGHIAPVQAGQLDASNFPGCPFP
jgi:opacity protein-like surface antigen